MMRMFKSILKSLINAREAQGRAMAARHLADMGYINEAKQIMLQGVKRESDSRGD